MQTEQTEKNWKVFKVWSDYNVSNKTKFTSTQTVFFCSEFHDPLIKYTLGKDSSRTGIAFESAHKKGQDIIKYVAEMLIEMVEH